MRPARSAARRIGRGFASTTPSALCGVLAAALLLGTADALSWLFAPGSSPLIALGGLVIEQTPAAVQDAVIATFGTDNKTVLLVAMGVGGALLAGLIGVLGRRRRRTSALCVAAVGVGLVLIVAMRPDTGLADVVPTLVGTVLGAAALPMLLSAWSRPSQESPQHRRPDEPQDGPAEGIRSRRRFLGLAGAAAAVSVGTLAFGRSVASVTRDAAEAAADLILPRPVRAALEIPAGASVEVDGVEPFITPNDSFYRIDTALAVPELEPEDWSLRIHGMVEQEVTLDMDELLALPHEEHHITLTCVSNPVGGDLLGTATWLGHPVRELLARAGPLDEADMVLSTSIDGFTASTPLEALTDERDSLLAVGMNGEPLPRQHGYPARLVVPGLYGYVSATKWVVDLEVTRFDRAEAYWTERGWDAEAPVLVSSRIDVPRSLDAVVSDAVVIAGSAWAQYDGVAEVEVDIDGDGWRAADLAEEVTADTWRQWRLDVEGLAPGRHSATVRAITHSGAVQSGDRRDPIPNAATGHHRIEFRVE